MNKKNFNSKKPFSQKPTHKNKKKHGQSNFEKNKSESLFYGKHPILAVLNNPNRTVKKLYILKKSYNEFEQHIKNAKADCVEVIIKDNFDDLIDKQTPHQGALASVKPIDNFSIEQLCSQTKNKEKSIVVMLDQITDPHNIGAIFRSSASFNADAIIMPDKNTPEETGSLAKSASGTLEITPYIKVKNLARAIDYLKDHGYWVLGLDSNSNQNIRNIDLPDKIVVIMGSEGKGLRKLTQEKCDFEIKLPISSKVESLNVSNATAITLYEIAMQKNLV